MQKDVSFIELSGYMIAGNVANASANERFAMWYANKGSRAT